MTLLDARLWLGMVVGLLLATYAAERTKSALGVTE